MEMSLLIFEVFAPQMVENEKLSKFKADFKQRCKKGDLEWLEDYFDVCRKDRITRYFTKKTKDNKELECYEVYTD